MYVCTKPRADIAHLWLLKFLSGARTNSVTTLDALSVITLHIRLWRFPLVKAKTATNGAKLPAGDGDGAAGGPQLLETPSEV